MSKATWTIAAVSALTLFLLNCGPGTVETPAQHAADDTTELASSQQGLGSSFSNVSSYCAATTDWGDWGQTSNTTWDTDTRGVVQFIINKTGIHSTTYT